MVAVCCLVGCVSKSKHIELQVVCDSLKSANELLLFRIDELENGEIRLVNLIKNSYEQEKYALADKYITQLIAKHPDSKEIASLSLLRSELGSKIKRELEAIEQSRKDSIRLANINNLGIWEINYYVDDFGEPTKQGYVSNSKRIIGVFSNTATQNSDLAVQFLIDNEDGIAIKLYEYAGNNPVKDNGLNQIYVQDNDGNRYKLTSYNHSDRLLLSSSGYYDETGNKLLEKNNSRMLWKILMKGGTIKFKIVESNYSTTTYNFTIENADFLENAITKMQLRK